MKTKFGAIIVDGRGKVGGHVASKNRGGSYIRTKVTPVNPQSSSQVSVRGRFTTYAQAWRDLTEAQRAAWNAAVLDFAKTDIFGDLRNPSGFNLFQKLNNNLSIAGIAQISVPPVPASVGVVELVSLASDNSDASLNLTLSDAVPAGTYVKVFATAGMSAGKSFVKSEYRLIKVLAPAALAAQDLSADYISKFGSIPEAGLKIFVKTEPINGTTGQTGAPNAISAVVVA